MSQLLLVDAATNTVQLGPFGVGSKGSANDFVFFPNGKQKMLNSNKFSDTHGRLDSCYSRYVALKKVSLDLKLEQEEHQRYDDGILCEMMLVPYY